MNQTFCSHLKNLRNGRQMTQTTLSQAIGIDQCTISNYERGTTIPPLDTAAEIAAFFGVSLDWLCGLSTQT